MLVHLASLVGTALCRLRPLGKSTFVPSAWLSWNSAEAQQYWSLGKVHDARLFQPVPRGILRQKEILRTAMIQILLAGLLLLLTALLGLLTWLTVAWFAFPQLLSGEVWHPLLIPLVGIIITTVLAIPFTSLQNRAGLSRRARVLVPLLYGFLWMPGSLVIGPSVADSNIWVTELKAGVLSALICFIVAMFTVRAVTALAEQRK